MGGTGFIGRHLVEELVSTGRKVYTVGRSEFTSDKVKHLKIKSLFDGKNSDLLLSGIDEVIYLV